MSVLFFKRFLTRPLQVASIIPSSKQMTRRIMSKFDFSEPRVIVEYGPGEGCHTREIVQRMHPGSTLLLLELDAELASHLRRQFRSNPDIHVINAGADEILNELKKRGFDYCDYVVSGIPFSTMEINKKRALLKKTYDALSPKLTSAFIIYQFTNELRQHATIFPRAQTEYFLQNIPPNFITAFYKMPLNGNGNGNGNGTSHNGHSPSAAMNGNGARH
ncbi:MAG TPA: rRNA adenine N-6-methyltransferase family protein [Chthoniobacteraceae bacterium]|nr:rRNA adenine N-6-methyltransferase family protein [Chthoniobacteraceae bacterium]